MAKNGNYNGNSQIVNSRDALVQEVDLNQDVVYLKTEYRFNNVDGNFNSSNNVDKVNFFYSLDGNNWTKIGEEIGLAYDLKMFTGYRFAIYSYPTRNTGGLLILILLFIKEVTGIRLNKGKMIYKFLYYQKIKIIYDYFNLILK